MHTKTFLCKKDISTYIHNSQGNIIALLDSAGVLVVEYKYNAWGTPISTTGVLDGVLDKGNLFRA